jgi:cyclic beta-1,2-glucan synthetase
MNIQADPSLLKGVIEPLPASADQPIRSTFFHEANMRKFGEELAQSRPAVPGLGKFDFQRRIRENGKKILEVYRATNDAQAKGEVITPAAQWLLDNHYLIDETVFQVKRDLPRRFYKELPAASFGGGSPLPRALAIAWAYVAHSDSSVSVSMFEAIVEGYQSVEPLKIGELWALPSLLRFVLIENLRRLALRVNRTREMRNVANKLADHIIAAGDGEATAAILARYAEYARDTTFTTQLLFRLRDGPRNAGRALVWLENELERHGTNAEAMIIAEHQTLSAGNVTTANIVRGLRLINDVDWTVWFEKMSRVDALLREQALFADLDFHSRDLYRAEIEELARGSGITEYAVAEQAVAMAREATAADPDTSDIGFFLVRGHREELEAAIDYRAPFTTRLKRAYRKAGWAGIVGPATAIAAILLSMIAAALGNIRLPDTVIAVMLVLLVLPAMEAGLSFFNKVVLLFLTPSRLVG